MRVALLVIIIIRVCVCVCVYKSITRFEQFLDKKTSKKNCVEISHRFQEMDRGKKVTPVFKYQHECDHVSLMLITCP